MLVQFVIALFVLRTTAGYDIFTFISELARSLLGFARDGVTFLTTPDIAAQTYFFFSVIPAIIFFVSFVQLLYYWGILQWFIGKFSVFFFWSMRVSGAEAVVASASPFIGQGESAMLIRPFVAHLTKAEIHQVMTSGFATIAGSVLVAYM
jgi:CNT family concentrative nucleoside transporter